MRKIARLRVAVWLLCSALAAAPAAAQSICDSPSSFCLGGGQVGQCPGWVDMNGNRMWDAGIDQVVSFFFSPTSGDLTICHPWCGSPAPVQLSSSDTILNQALYNGYLVKIEGLDGGGNPVTFSMSQGGTPLGAAALVDGEGDGCYELLDARLANGSTYVRADLDFLDTDGDKNPDHVSLNWAFASLYGMNGDCGMTGGDPQIWIPMSGGRIDPSFDNMYSSGCLRAREVPIPTMSEWGAALFAFAMLAFGCWWLRARRALA